MAEAAGFSNIAGNLFEEEGSVRESAAEEPATVTDVVEKVAGPSGPCARALGSMAQGASTRLFRTFV